MKTALHYQLWCYKATKSAEAEAQIWIAQMNEKLKVAVTTVILLLCMAVVAQAKEVQIPKYVQGAYMICDVEKDTFTYNNDHEATTVYHDCELVGVMDSRAFTWKGQKLTVVRVIGTYYNGSHAYGAFAIDAEWGFTALLSNGTVLEISTRLKTESARVGLQIWKTEELFNAYDGVDSDLEAKLDIVIDKKIDPAKVPVYKEKAKVVEETPAVSQLKEQSHHQNMEKE